MVRLQLGIRYSIGRMNSVSVNGAGHHDQAHSQLPDMKLKPYDFVDKSKTFFPSSGRWVQLGRVDLQAQYK